MVDWNSCQLLPCVFFSSSYCLSGSRKHAARISFAMYSLCLSLAVIVLLLQLRICTNFFLSFLFIYSSLSFSSLLIWSVKGDFIPCFICQKKSLVVVSMCDTAYYRNRTNIYCLRTFFGVDISNNRWTKLIEIWADFLKDF